MQRVDGKGRIPHDRRQPIAVARSLFPRDQLGAGALFDRGIVDMFVDRVERAEPGEQLLRALLADAGHARNIVRGIAHQALEVDQADGIETVFFPEQLGCELAAGVLPHAARNQLDGGMIGNQLQAVPVARDDQAIVPVLFRDPADRADQVVGFKPGQFAPADAHRVQHFLHDRKLHGKLLRHTLAGRFIGFKPLVAERLFLAVKTDNRPVGRFLLAQLQEGGQKAENGVCEQTVGRVQRTHAIIGAVQYAVAVDDHQFHANTTSFYKFIFILFYYNRTAPIFQTAKHGIMKEIWQRKSSAKTEPFQNYLHFICRRRRSAIMEINSELVGLPLTPETV